MAYQPSVVSGVIQGVKPSTRTELIRYDSENGVEAQTGDDIKAFVDPNAPDVAQDYTEGYGHQPFGSYQVDPTRTGAGTLPPPP